MKILLANNKLRYLGGTETYAYAMAGELRRQGHEVDAFSFRSGLISDRMRSDYGVRIVSEKDIQRGSRKYDVILANHSTTVKFLREAKSGFIIQTCHGVTTALEQPSPFAHAYVAISEELVEHIREVSGKDATCIVNGVDCDRFSPGHPIGATLKRVLSLSHDQDLNQRMGKAFANRGITMLSLNKFVNPVWDVERYINQADMVVSLGRGAYEAMACARPVLVLDQRKGRPLKGDGLILPENMQEFLRCNCRGQAFQYTDVEEMVEMAIAGYTPSLGTWCRQFALENLNIEHQVQKYIDLCRQLIWYMF